MVKLSVSNIAWSSDMDTFMYGYLAQHKFDGIEIAPTRLYPNKPYECMKEAKKFREDLYKKYSLSISSMQSIWYGKNENIFESEMSRKSLIAYTKKAIDFAYVLGCRNLVFGCPKNRIRNGRNVEFALSFFKEVAYYAIKKEVVFSLEANPKIYNTDYINYTKDAFEVVKIINSDGLRVNLDIGTMIENNETISILEENFEFINHIHISEPFLKPLVKRKIHKDVYDLILKNKYSGFVSLEMGNNKEAIFDSLAYFEELFA